MATSTKWKDYGTFADGVMTIADAADLMGVHKRTLERMIDDRKIGYTRANGHRRIPRSEIIRWQQEHYVPPTA